MTTTIQHPWHDRYPAFRTGEQAKAYHAGACDCHDGYREADSPYDDDELTEWWLFGRAEADGDTEPRHTRFRHLFRQQGYSETGGNRSRSLRNSNLTR